MTMHHLHIFLSSPGDVSRERQLAREVIDRIQSERAHRDRLKLEVVAWDKPGAGTAMPAQMEPQEAIKQGLKKPSDCDIVIVIFWARMGTPLSEKHLKPDGSRYRSGTEYEYLEALGAAKKFSKPDVLVYRRKKPPDVNLADPERKEKEKQWDLVEEFFAEFRNPDGSFQSFFKEYDEPSDFEKLLGDDLRDLITKYLDSHPKDEAELTATAQEAFWEESPFPGLRAFTPEEAVIFHGRSPEIDSLIARLSDSKCRFIAVIGASGSGKSSLVAAGLLPALEDNAIHGSKNWVWARSTPGEVGSNPFIALAIALKSKIENRGLQPRDMANELEKKANVFKKFLAMALENRPHWAELLLFIDQFEELFTLVDKKYQGPFVDLLSQVEKVPRVRTVLTMRADFYPRCLEWSVLDALLAKGHYPLLAPRTGALHEMITQPAERARVPFENGLAQRILDDTGTEPGALALMAYALSELWQKSKGSDRVLTHAAYDSFNGVDGAIGKRAEETFNSLEEEKSTLEAALAHVFRELVEVDERGVATRRRAPLSDVTGDASAQNLVSALTDARLLVTSRGEGNEATVEVAHEAIFTNWPRLEAWIEATSDDLRLRRQISQAAVEWEARDQEKKYLWPDDRAVDVVDMLDRLGLGIDDLSETERRFLGPIDRESMLAELVDPAINHERRATIGIRLSLLGDPRPGVGLRPDGLPDIVWCEVPSGEITLETERSLLVSRLFRGFKTTTFRVEPFYIAKFPVTWIQYRAFLDADDGFREPSWWQGLLFQVAEQHKQFNQRDNHPADTLCWLEAVAFCRWLTAKLGYEVRLPTEWEWQQAATGGDAANAYPWGESWDSDRANTFESGLNRTTAVGLYSHGASPAGALDMSGNEWEWCLNEYENPKRVELTGDSRRSVRGGSWLDYRVFARCAVRYGSLPDDRYYNFGFRVCCASPIF
jgi:formylglycine-generating enzyme required for sulfatase activity